jgi:hypothetical protein
MRTLNLHMQNCLFWHLLAVLVVVVQQASLLGGVQRQGWLRLMQGISPGRAHLQAAARAAAPHVVLRNKHSHL